MNELPPKPFSRQIFIDQEQLVGARWWQESLQHAASTALSRRQALRLLLGMGGAIAATGLIATLASDHDDDEQNISMDALELQRVHGWDAGHPGAALRFVNASNVDSGGSLAWRDGLGRLAAELAPAQSALMPFYVPTLFQSLAVSDSLRAAMAPVAPPPGDVHAARGEAILSLFRAVKMPQDIAIILDLEGPASVAVAAAMAEGFDPVFTFDNWPHPLGVVPSHLTLGAVIYERPAFAAAVAKRTSPAPPVFVLDRNRLAHYTDEDTQFDNRYVAKLPTAQNLRALGIAHVLYVTPTKSDLRELDDLNDDFVAFADAGIDVKVMPLTDLDSPTPVASAAQPHYYGGHSQTHLWFWHSYGWHTSRAASVRPSSPPPAVSSGAAYRPVSRPTIFSSRTLGGGAGIGKQKPSGFGRVSVRTSKSGAITGVRTGRTGSFGRAGSSWGG